MLINAALTFLRCINNPVVCVYNRALNTNAHNLRKLRTKGNAQSLQLREYIEHLRGTANRCKGSAEARALK
jgi:hypothetical protein